MAEFTTDTMSGLEALYTEKLRDLYNAENQIVQALAKMKASATRPELQQLFEMHAAQSEEQSQRIAGIFEQMGQSPNGKVCKRAFGLIAEGQAMIQSKEKGPALDAALISATQSVEHYEIANYGTARTWANLLGKSEDAELLDKTIHKEGETDKKLIKLAEKLVNKEAASA